MNKKQKHAGILAIATVLLASCDRAPQGMGSISSSVLSIPTAIEAMAEATSEGQPVLAKGQSPIKEAPSRMQEVGPVFPPAAFGGVTPLPELNPPPNLDRSGKPTLTLSLPNETRLLSTGKPVISSDSAPFTGDLAQITDGEKEAGDGYYVELAPGMQWVQIDLGQVKAIDAVWMWHFYKDPVVYKDVVVGVADNPEFTNPTIIFNNDYDNTLQFGPGADQSYVETNHGRAIKAPANTKGRYLRFHSNGRLTDEMNHYIEVEVYGH